MNTKEIYIKNSRWQNLKAWIKNNLDSNIAIIYCHWFSWDSSGFIKPFAEYFWDKYLTCRFDFSWQWQSEGNFINSSIDNELDDLKCVINYLRENYKTEKLFLQWHSFWVAITTIYAWSNWIDWFISLSWEWNLKDAIFLEFNEEQLNDFKEKWVALYENWTKDWEMDKLWIQFLDNMKKYSDNKYISNILCPWLFVHWTNDYVIPFKQTYEAAYLYKWRKDLIFVDWADHLYGLYSWNDNKIDFVIQIIEDWLYNIISPKNMDSFYKMKGDWLHFTDKRMDEIRHNIKPLFKTVQLIETIDQKLHWKLEDCRHKLEAVWYSLLLIKNEIINFENTSHEILRNYSSMVWKLTSKTEFWNDILIFETESFLFQVKSSLDLLIQALKNIYPFLSDNTWRDSESFLSPYNKNIWKYEVWKIIIKKLKDNNWVNLAGLFEKEINAWIEELIMMRNKITHQSWLDSFFCFVFYSENPVLDKPKMPSGEYLDDYCQKIYDNLLKFYKTIFEEYIMVELKDKLP